MTKGICKCGHVQQMHFFLEEECLKQVDYVLQHGKGVIGPQLGTGHRCGCKEFDDSPRLATV